MDFVVVWFQKRKHGGDEALNDVHKHKKKKQGNIYLLKVAVILQYIIFA
jgi:hypothetical protein